VSNGVQDWRRKIEQEQPPCRFVAVVQPFGQQRQRYPNQQQNAIRPASMIGTAERPANVKATIPTTDAATIDPILASQ
jgi:hypothetical protein